MKNSVYTSILTLFLGIFAFTLVAQNTTPLNNFSLNLNVPLIVDEVSKTEYIPEKMKALNSFQEYTDKATSFSFRVTNYPTLEYFGNLFRGAWENEYFPYEKVNIKGQVSLDRKILEWIIVDYQMNVEDNPKESEIISLKFENIPIKLNGLCVFNKATSKIELLDYRYTKTESSSRSMGTYTKTGKAINLDEIPSAPELVTGKFRIVLNMDGPPSYKITVEKTRGAAPDWLPPLFTTSDTEASTEPGSIGIYEECPPWIPINSPGMITLCFLEKPKYKVLERIKNKQLQDELNLSESGLVKENSQVKNNLLKEQIALLIDYKPENKTLKCTVTSASGEKRIEGYPVTEENYGLVITPFCWEIEKAVDEFLSISGPSK